MKIALIALAAVGAVLLYTQMGPMATETEENDFHSKFMEYLSEF